MVVAVSRTRNRTALNPAKYLLVMFLNCCDFHNNYNGTLIEKRRSTDELKYLRQSLRTIIGQILLKRLRVTAVLMKHSK